MQRRLLALGIILVVVCMAGCDTSIVGGKPTATVTRPTAAPTATAALAIPNFPLAGWHTGGPPYATAIAFASDSSGAAYVCGANGAATAAGVRPIAVAVSTDNASTWTIETTPAESVLCSLSIDPTDPQDVALFTTTCAEGCTSDPVTHLYRSHDAGQTWTELTLPTLPAENAGTPAFTDVLVWSGATLIAESSASVPNGHPVQHLLASVSAGPFARIDQASLFANSNIGKVFTLGTAIYAEIFPAGCAGTYFCALAKTTDGGATWRQIALRYQQQAVDLLAAGGASLIVGTPGGAIQHAQIALTTNDGQTWQALPATPAGLAYYLVADGTLFLSDLDSGALYRLTSGAQQWRSVVPSPAAMPTGLDDGSLVFQCDANGHPVAVWRDAGLDQTNNMQYPGLQYHPL